MTTPSKTPRTIRRALSLLLIALVALCQLGDFPGSLQLATTLEAATGTLMPTPYQSVLDTSGNPVSGACVWTYTAGTSTPVATYSDSALTTPNSNPIVADSAGRFVAWLTTGTSYKFTFETACTAPAHGSVIRTVDNVLAVPGTSNPTTDISTVNARCTLSSGTPVTTSDVTAATSVYIEPYRGNRIALYDGASWNLRTVTATSFAVPATTSTMYDVFVYDNSSTPTYETLAWTNDTTRATAVTTQDGVLSKSGALTRRYLCSFRTTTVSGQTEDSMTKRYVWNYYNRVARILRRTESTASWTYTTASFHQANAAAANQVDVVIGVAEVQLSLLLQAMPSSTAAAGAITASVGIGEDSTTTVTTGNTGTAFSNPATNSPFAVTASLKKYPAVGRHFYAWLEYSTASGTTTWYSTAAGPASAAGLDGWIEG